MSSGSPNYPEKLRIEPLAEAPWTEVRVPGSKSITNRALVLAALDGKARPCDVLNCLRSEDTEVMVEALRALGFAVEADWEKARVRVAGSNHANRIPAVRAELFVGNSGTTMRFLTA